MNQQALNEFYLCEALASLSTMPPSLTRSTSYQVVSPFDSLMRHKYSNQWQPQPAPTAATTLKPPPGFCNVAAAVKTTQMAESMSSASCISSSDSSGSQNNNNNNSGGGVDRTKLFVGNLASDTTLADLFELFAPFGDINQELCCVKDENYAFIHFFNERSAENALKAVNGALFRNRYVRVEYSNSHGHLRKFMRRNISFSLSLFSIRKHLHYSSSQ